MKTPDSDTSPTDEQIANALNEVKAQKRGGGRTALTEEQKAQRALEVQAEKERKKAEKDAKREAKKAAKAADRKPAHMAKVKRAEERLPQLSGAAQEVITGLFNAFGEDEITGIVAHTAHKLRVKATLTAQTVEIKQDMLVRIKDPNSKFDGELGTVTKAQRIRCYVRPLKGNKDIYLFTSQVTPVSEAETVSSGTEDVSSLAEPFTSVG